MDDDGRRTTHHDGRQLTHIAIGHLSDSGDLKSTGASVILAGIQYLQWNALKWYSFLSYEMFGNFRSVSYDMSVLMIDTNCFS